MSIAISLPIHDWTPHFKAVLGSLNAQSAPIQLAAMMTHEDPRTVADIENSGLAFDYVRTGSDGGQAAAIAEGWANTHSLVLAWLNTDDALTGDILAGIISAFESDPDLDVIYGHSTISDEDNTVWGYHPAVLPQREMIRRTNIISQPSCFVRRSAVEAIGGINTELQYTMDWDLWLRLYENGAKFQFLDCLLSNVTWAHEKKTAGLSKQRLLEFSKILRRTQSLYKTGIGISALIRSNRDTYKRAVNITDNCHPLIAGSQQTSLALINMHSEPKTRLRLAHGAGGVEISGMARGDAVFEVKKKDREAVLHFRDPIGSGVSALLQIQGRDTHIFKAEWL